MTEYTKRWYDKNNDMNIILDSLKGQSPELIDNLAENIMNFSNIIRQNINELETEEPISIGKERILGYYKSFRRRRWYDRNWTLLSIFNVISTLPKSDYENIVAGIKNILKEMKLL